VGPGALAQTAAERFLKGADAPFLACFDPSVDLYWEPAVSERPIVSSRAALERWLADVRAANPRLQVAVTEPTEHGNGAVLEAIITRDAEPKEVWRVALAVCVADELICQVRAFWSRAAAIAWVARFQ
jgi:hypothetical protein